MRFRSARVRTADSYTSPGKPRWLELDGEYIDIEDVLTHWRQAYSDPTFYPEDFYMVRSIDKRTYILRYCSLFDSWWVKESEEAAS